MKAITQDRYGGPEVLEVRDIDTGEVPSQGAARRV